MNIIRELSWGLLGGILSVAILLGAAALSSAETFPFIPPSSGLAPGLIPPSPVEATPGATVPATSASQPAVTDTQSSATASAPIGQPPAASLIVACGPPLGWVRHVVLPEETLNHFSLVYNVPISELQKANCMGESTLLRPGAVIFVPQQFATEISKEVDLSSIPASGASNNSPESAPLLH